MEYEWIAHVITCRHTPESIRGDDGEVGSRGALLIGFQQSETLGVATSVHDRRENATRIEKSQSCDKSQSCERLDELQRFPQSADALRVESVKIIEPMKRDHEAAECGEGVKRGCNSGCAEDREWGDIFDTVVRRTKRRRYMREIFLILCARQRICHIL